MCVCVLAGYMVVCIVQEYVGQVHPIGFATVPGFLLVSKRLAEVCHRAHRQTCACTHTRTDINNRMLYRCPPMSWKPYILSKREDAVCQKDAMVTFFLESPLPRNL